MWEKMAILFILVCLIFTIGDKVDYAATVTDAYSILSQEPKTLNNTIVYGFWPDWPYLESYQPDWNILTHVSYYKWTLNSDGTLTNPENMSNYYAVRDLAHQHGVKITLCIKSSDPYVIDSVIANHQTEFINNVLNLLQMYGADGVNLDLETPNDINSITRRIIIN